MNVSERDIEINDKDESWATSSKTKYGELKPLLNTTQRKMNSFSAVISRKIQDNWDNDFEIENVVVPKQLRFSSKSLSTEMTNFRSLSEKTLVLQNKLKEIHCSSEEKEKNCHVDEARAIVEFISDKALENPDNVRYIKRLLSSNIPVSLNTTFYRLDFTKDLIPPLLDHIDHLIYELNHSPSL